MNDSGDHESDLGPSSSLDRFIFSTFSEMFQEDQRIGGLTKFPPDTCEYSRDATVLRIGKTGDTFASILCNG